MSLCVRAGGDAKRKPPPQKSQKKLPGGKTEKPKAVWDHFPGLDISQLLGLGLDGSSKVEWAGRVATSHESQLAGGIVDQDAGELVAAGDFLNGIKGLAITGGVPGGIDLLQGVVGVFDEVKEEEGGWVRGRGGNLRVSFECPVSPMLVFGSCYIGKSLMGWRGLCLECAVRVELAHRHGAFLERLGVRTRSAPSSWHREPQDGHCSAGLT